MLSVGLTVKVSFSCALFNLQAPGGSLQRSSKLQPPNQVAHCGLVLEVSLELGGWSLEFHFVSVVIFFDWSDCLNTKF
jgi:hypothetical protein